jgi:hypothetical protein
MRIELLAKLELSASDAMRGTRRSRSENFPVQPRNGRPIQGGC